MQFKKKTLENGLRIITVKIPKSLTTTVLVLTETGSKYETKHINGISHFLEHLCFKGTEKRPGAKAVSEELDGLGASYNAFTGHEYTGYYAKTEPRHVLRALDVVSDIYVNSTFPSEEIEKERGVIIGEIEMYEDNPQRHIGDLFTGLLYGNQPAGWNIAGTRKSVRGLTRDDIVAYHEAHYVASATSVVVAGDFNEKEVISAIGKAFSGVRTSRKHGKEKVHEEQKKPALGRQNKKTSQTHIIVGFRSLDVHHKDNPALTVLAAILGGGMSSRLFQKIRDEMGAGYYISASNDALTDHGYLGIMTGVDNTRVLEVLRAILHEVRKIRDEKVGDAELQKVKNYIIGNMFSGLETSSALAMYYGDLTALKAPLKTPEEKASEIRAVSPADVLRTARFVFQNNRLNMAFIGRAHEEKEIQKILNL